TTGLFDVKSQTMKTFPNTNVINIAGSPIRPDQRGFLVLKGNAPGDAPAYTFIDWQGKEQALKMPPELIPEMQQVSSKLDNDCLTTLIWAPALHESRWDKDVAEIGLSGNTLRLDTGKLEV